MGLETIKSARREPKITQLDYLTLSRLSQHIGSCAKTYLDFPDCVVLDVGCGDKPYEPFFHSCKLYLGLDIKPKESVDVIGNSEKLPFGESVFSVVLCFQVLEHVRKVEKAVHEIARVLKPEGYLFLSIPGMWPFHPYPHDYWRWTEQGIREMLNEFAILAIHNCGGPAVSFIQIFELLLSSLIASARPYHKMSKAGTSASRLPIVLLNKLGDAIDMNTKLNPTHPDLIANYFVVARKKR